MYFDKPRCRGKPAVIIFPDFSWNMILQNTFQIPPGVSLPNFLPLSNREMLFKQFLWIGMKGNMSKKSPITRQETGIAVGNSLLEWLLYTASNSIRPKENRGKSNLYRLYTPYLWLNKDANHIAKIYGKINTVTVSPILSVWLRSGKSSKTLHCWQARCFLITPFSIMWSWAFDFHIKESYKLQLDHFKSWITDMSAAAWDTPWLFYLPIIWWEWIQSSAVMSAK